MNKQGKRGFDSNPNWDQRKNRLSLRRGAVLAWDLVEGTGVRVIMDKDVHARHYASDLSSSVAGAVAAVVCGLAVLTGGFGCPDAAPKGQKDPESCDPYTQSAAFLTIALCYLMPLALLRLKAARLTESVKALYIGYAEEPAVLSQVEATLGHRFGRVMEEGV